MLSQTLNTNEVKNAAGTEVEFSRRSQEGRTLEYAKIGENPSQAYRLKVSHQDVGSGIKRRRRSVVRFDLTSISGVDSVTPITTSAYAVLDFPEGASTSTSVAADALAHLMSFLASTGANTTILYDCTGHGASALLNGTL